MRKKSHKRMPPHIVLPNGMWRFTKRKPRHHSGVPHHHKPKKVYAMARRRSYRGYGRKVYRASRRGPTRHSVMKNALDGAIVGLAQTAIPDVIPLQDPLISLGVGWWRHNPTLTTLGGIQLGAGLAGMLGGGLNLGGKIGQQAQV